MLVHELHGIYVLWLREMIKFWRDKLRILTALIQPAVWLFIMGKGLGATFRGPGGGDYATFMFPGVVAMTVLFTSVFGAISIIWDREFGMLKEILVAPISRTSIVIGKALSGSTTAMVQGTLVLVFAPLVGVQLTATSVILTMGMMFLISLAMSGGGIMVAARLQNFHNFQFLMNFVVMPMYFLSGAVFPITNLPLWMKSIAVANPLAYGVDALKGILLGRHEFSMVTDISVILAMAAVTIAASAWMFRRENG